MTLITESNILIIYEVMKYLGLTPPRIVRISEIAQPSERTQRIITVCHNVGAEIILCGDGKARVVHDEKRLCAEGIHFKDVGCLENHPVYRQFHSDKHGGEFVPGLSFIDALLNIGRVETRTLIITWKVNEIIASTALN